MKEFTDLTDKEKDEVYSKASAFYSNHREHVKSMMKNSEYSIAPSGSDMFRPELWKISHWTWFFGKVK